AAEAAGYDFVAASDHAFPWLDEQGHSPYTWSVLGAVAHATERVELMTYVTCPTMGYHPAVVAQQASTNQQLSHRHILLGQRAGEHADAMIAVAPEASLGERFDAAGGRGKRRIGQVGLCYDSDEGRGRKRAREQFQWFTGGWPVMAELPNPHSFAAASDAVSE